MRDPRRAGSFEKCDVISCAMQIEFGLKYEFCLPNSKAPGDNISVTVKYGDTLELTHYAERPPIRWFSTSSSPLFFYSVFEGVANLIISSFSWDEGTRWVQNSIFDLKEKHVCCGRKSLCIFSASFIEEGGGAGKTHTHLLSQQQSSRDSTLSVFLRKENGATGEFLRTNSKMEQGLECKNGSVWEQ